MRPLLGLADDADAEVRAQAANVLGQLRFEAAYEFLVKRLQDEKPRVRFFAAQGLARLGRCDAIAPVLAMLRENNDRDAYLRHAGVMALAGTGDVGRLLEFAGDPSSPVRLGVLLALRRLRRPEVAAFLDDSDEQLVVEAARAIYDVPIPAAMPCLAELIQRHDLAKPLMRRVMNATYRVGGPEGAAALVGVAADTAVDQSLRVEALDMLANWEAPPGRDRIVGLWRPVAPQPREMVATAVLKRISALLDDPERHIQELGAALAGRLGLHSAAAKLAVMIADTNRSAQVRAAALGALEQLGDRRLDQAVQLAVAGDVPQLRSAGLRVLAGLKPAQAVDLLEQVLRTGGIAEQQQAFATLAELPHRGADRLLAGSLDELLAGRVATEVQLDLLQAAANRDSAAVREKLTRYEASRPTDDPLALYRETLAGGDAVRGNQVFFQKTAVACLRCHKVDGRGGEVGPELTGIGKKQNRSYLLESLVDPNRQIAEGFETVVITTTAGKVLTGIIKAEDQQQVQLIDDKGNVFRLPKGEIDTRDRGQSAMPADLVKQLTKAELRDLVEFLATRK